MAFLISKFHIENIKYNFFSYKFAVLLLFLFSFLLRLIGINWDSGFLFHPDERAILMHGYDLSFYSLKSLDFFNSDLSTLNPKWFNYGSFPVYFVKIISFISNLFTNTSIYELRIPLRVFSAFIDSISVIFIFKLSSIFLDKKWSFLTAFFLSISLINIQNSHFFTTDIFITNFSLVIIYFSYLNVKETSNLKSFILGLFFALGLAFKFSFVMMIIPIFLSFYLSTKMNDLDYIFLLKCIFIFIISALFSLFLFQPYMFLDFNTYFSHINEQSKMVRGIVDFPYTRQYQDTTSFIYPVNQIFKWGLGPFISIFAFLGGIYFLFLSLKNRSVFGLLIFSWFVPYFVINASFQVKFMRYFLPLIPFLIFFSVVFIKLINDKVSSKYKNKKVNYFLLFLLLIPTIHFSFSFINGIYLTEHPAFSASKWLNARVTSNDLIIQDHWEESIPRLENLNLSHDRLELYNPDSPQKFEKIFNQLSQSEYYVVFSNRLYATIPRLNNRYPASIVFYEKLFDGSLGYEIVNFQKQSMNLFGINYSENYFERIDIKKPELISSYEEKFFLNIDFGWSDESFSVYDHPNVIIFQNKEKFSKEELIKILDFNNYDDISFFDLSPEIPYKKYEFDYSQDSLVHSEQFFLSEKSVFIQTIFWFLVVSFLGFISIPIFYKLFINLQDFGFGFYKFFGLIIYGFLIWLLSSNNIIGFMIFEMILVLILFSMLSSYIFIKNRSEIIFYISKAKYKILTVEIIFLMSFLTFLCIRLMNPDLWHPYRGGEKPMDFAYLNAILRSTSFPPYDPWFSGYTLNYYYYGQYLVALISKLSGIPSNISYNLAIPTFFSYASVLAFSFSSNFTYLFRKAKGLNFDWYKIPLISGISSILFILIFGNFDSIIQIYKIILGEQEVFDYWRSTRIVSMISSGLEINEFPLFTFLFADLHAHLLSIPMLLSLIFLSFLFYYESSSQFIRSRDVLVLLFLGLLTGSIKATNSWDYPLSLVIVFLSISLLSLNGPRTKKIKIAKVLFYFSLYFLFSKALFFNFDNSFIMPEFAVNFSQWKTPLWSMLQILLLPMFLSLFYIFLYASNFKVKFKLFYPSFLFSKNKKLIMFTFIFFLLILFVLFYKFLTVFSLFIGILFFGAIYILKRKFFENDSQLFIWITLLFILGFSISAFTEIFVIKNDINRMNTFFKFNFQSWILLNLGSSILIPFIIDEINSKYKKYIFVIIISLLAIIGMSYPVYSIKPRISDRFDNKHYSLDGMKYMQGNQYSQNGNLINLSDSYKALAWINNNIKGNPVILEDSTDLYSWSSRISIYSGLPSVLGWDWHQKQQRSLESNSVTIRKKQIQEFYSTSSIEYINDFLDFYDVRLIIYGNVEIQNFPEFSNRFESLNIDGISKIYDQDNYKIYEYIATN